MRRKVHTVYGEGFNYRGGGFAQIIINGHRYDAQAIAALVERVRTVSPVEATAIIDSQGAATADENPSAHNGPNSAREARQVIDS